MVAKLTGLKSSAAWDLSSALDMDFDVARSAVSVFLGEATEPEFYHLHIDKEGFVESTKARNLIYNRGDLTYVDFAEAISYGHL